VKEPFIEWLRHPPKSPPIHGLEVVANMQLIEVVFSPPQTLDFGTIRVD